MIRPRISDEFDERVARKAEELLEDSPIDVDELGLEARLEIVFEAAAEETSRVRTTAAADAGTDTADDLDEEESDHPGGDAAAEALILDELE